MAGKKLASKKKKRFPKRRRLLLLLTALALFLVCVVIDCGRKGYFRPEIFSGEKTEKKQEKSVALKDEKKIRVLITDSEMDSIYHEEIEIRATGEMTVTDGKKSRRYPAGKKLTVRASGKKKGTIVISCAHGKINVPSVTRSGGTPSYRGTMKIVRKQEGLLLINTLTLREYLYGVVPGEMPAAYPMEALKAQAVCARSFAWRQMHSNRYKEYGADVDDTTAFQVYQTSGEAKRAKKAVDKTAGEMLQSDGKVITAYYYSTSWGYSASEAEAWGGGEGKYYPVRFQKVGAKTPSKGLSGEEDFYSFITGGGEDTIDSGYDWYRWEVKLTAESLGDCLGIGRVKNICIQKRGKSGLIQKIRITGMQGRTTIEGQEDIRRKMYPAGTEIVKKKTGETAVLSMLPSAAFTVLEGSDGEHVTYTLIGGGLGHGVGMSQNGAAQMAREGYNYHEILEHYYCKIRWSV